VRLLPADTLAHTQSQANLTQEGNRSTEGDVRRYLERTLGDEAPQPTWGLPDDRNGCKGWIGYMAQLLSWARELQAQHRKVPAEPVTVDEAGRVRPQITPTPQIIISKPF